MLLRSHVFWISCLIFLKEFPFLIAAVGPSLWAQMSLSSASYIQQVTSFAAANYGLVPLLQRTSDILGTISQCFGPPKKN